METKCHTKAEEKARRRKDQEENVARWRAWKEAQTQNQKKQKEKDDEDEIDIDKLDDDDVDDVGQEEMLLELENEMQR